MSNRACDRPLLRLPSLLNTSFCRFSIPLILADKLRIKINTRILKASMGTKRQVFLIIGRLAIKMIQELNTLLCISWIWIPLILNQTYVWKKGLWRASHLGQNRQKRWPAAAAMGALLWVLLYSARLDREQAKRYEPQGKCALAGCRRQEGVARLVAYRSHYYICPSSRAKVAWV